MPGLDEHVLVEEQTFDGQVRKLVKRIYHDPGNREEPPDTHVEYVLVVDGVEIALDSDALRIPLALAMVDQARQHYIVRTVGGELGEDVLRLAGKVLRDADQVRRQPSTEEPF